MFVVTYRQSPSPAYSPLARGRSRTGLGWIRRCSVPSAAARSAWPATGSGITPGWTASRCSPASCTRG